MSVYRSLRFQLIAIVVATVATILGVSEWLDTRVSERSLEHDLRERAVLALHRVESLSGRVEPSQLLKASPEGEGFPPPRLRQ
jgi:hypothetical protein